MSELNWGGPLWGLLALIPVVLVLGWSLTNRVLILRQMRLMKAIRWHRWRTFLMALTFLGGLLAYARPQYGKESQTVEKSHRDIVVLLDVSRSMLAEDIKRHFDAKRICLSVDKPRYVKKLGLRQIRVEVER